MKRYSLFSASPREILGLFTSKRIERHPRDLTPRRHDRNGGAAEGFDRQRGTARWSTLQWVVLRLTQPENVYLEVNPREDGLLF